MLEVTQGDVVLRASAWEQLHTWVCEQSTIRVYLAVGNLRNFLTYTTSRLDGFPGHGTAQLGEAWYHGILVGTFVYSCLWSRSILVVLESSDFQ